MKQYKVILLSAFAAAIAFSCKKADESTTDNNTTVKQVITAYTCQDSKISFEDHGTDGLKTYWSENDGFSVYDSDGNLAATFTLQSGSGSMSAVFVLDGSNPLVEGESYTAVYPKTTAATLTLRNSEVFPQEQKGNAYLTHLEGVCKMEDTITVESDEDITISFNHEMAVMSMFFYLPSDYEKSEDGELVGLEVTNGDHIETLQLSSTMGISGLISTHLLIEPNSGARSVSFKLLTDQGKCYSYSGITTKDYEKGYRYNALIENNFGSESQASGYYITPGSSDQGVDDILATQSVWIINDAASIAENNALQSALQQRLDNSVFVIAPFVTALQADALSDCKAIKLLSLHSATSLGDGALAGTTSISDLFLTQSSDWQAVSSSLLSNISGCTLRLDSSKAGEISNNSKTWSPVDSNNTVLATLTPFSSIILSSEVVIDPTVSVAPFEPLTTLTPDAFNVDDVMIPDYDSSYEY